MGSGSKVGKQVTLDLIDANTGQIVATTTTDSNGSYRFANLLPGDYFIEFTPPASLPVSSTPTSTLDDNVDGDDNGIQLDSNGDGVTDGVITSPVITLEFGTEPIGEPGKNGGKDGAEDEGGDMTIDFGLIGCTEIGGHVWIDADVDGCDDSNEAPIPGIDVELFECDGAGNPITAGGPVGTTQTDANGDYVFNETNAECLIPGTEYIVVFDIPTGFRTTTKDVCGDPNQSDANPDGTTECLDPTDPPSTNIDGGLVPLMSIGSTVFSDDNNNGIQDPNELNVGQKGKTITLDLFDAAGNFIATTQTDANGSYIFMNLDPGDYFVEFTPPASLPVSSTPTSTADDNVDGDDNGMQTDSNGDGLTDGVITSPIISLDPGAEPTNATETASNGAKDKVGNSLDENGDMTVDFGLVPLLSVGSELFSDINDNGIKDAGELTLGQKGKSVTLELFDANTGALVATTVTNTTGGYVFDNLLPGDYFIEFTPPASSAVSSTGSAPDNQTDDDDNGMQADTNGDGVTDGVVTSTTFTLAPGTEPTGEPGKNTVADDDNSDFTIDFGLRPVSDLELIKLVSDPTPNIGDIITYTIEVTNTGLAAATNVVVTDAVPNGFAGITNISAGGALAGNTVTWTIPSVGVGQTATVTFDATVLAPGPGVDFNNVATISAMDGVDSDSTPGDAPDSDCLLYTSPSPRDGLLSRMPSSA